MTEQFRPELFDDSDVVASNIVSLADKITYSTAYNMTNLDRAKLNL
jgi:hypothetical protein